ncbi:MAG TPA: heterodisulfide reductase-related iron-sulfur binding cluster [Gemmatimonadales bacterium]|nr:heterodisulfide reductase-related iron-sulfur binding cluster [Gemmatimonadales bacterium]
MTAVPAFPPSRLPASFWRGLDACVHCGFCLPACPTYEATLDEADSPRGRIVLMRALERGDLGPDDPGLRHHLDRCLGCRACESACPSGVVYGPALEAARARLASAAPLPAPVRLVLWILARPALQKPLWLLSRLLRATGLPGWLAREAGRGAPRVAWLAAMLAASGGPGVGRRWSVGPSARRLIPDPDRRPPTTEPCALFTGCVQAGLFSHVHEATVKALQHNGLRVEIPPAQVCCGALAAHAGAADLATELARANLHCFADTRGPIVVNAAGCGAMLRHYAAWFADDPDCSTMAREFSARVRDVTEVLAERGPAPGGRLPLRVAYDAPCHLLHAQKIADAPLAVLRAIPGLELAPLEGSDRCCGAAGLYSLVQPELSLAVLEPRLAALRRSAADVLATGNPGCQMHIGAGILIAGIRTEVRHPVELLAWSYER